MTLLVADKLSHRYDSPSLFSRQGDKPVVDAVSLTLADNECVALVGRSGCGKSTLARLLMGLESPSSGVITFRQRAISTFSTAEWREFRRSVQWVQQDALSAVDPRHTLYQIISAPLRYLTSFSPLQCQLRVASLLQEVGLNPEDANKLPAQLSGGQLQRVCIARALAITPKLLILDEALSSLDIPLQLQLMTLLKKLFTQQGIACLFITHDLRLAAHFCERLVVMDEGKIIEQASVTEIARLQHPLSQQLYQAILPAMPHHY